MQNNLPSYLDIYTNTFKNNSYSAEHHIQYDFAINEIKKIYDSESTFTLIDIGSGRGHLINLILKNFKHTITFT